MQMIPQFVECSVMCLHLQSAPSVRHWNVQIRTDMV